GVAEQAEPAIVGMGVAFGNVFKGIAGIIDAFLPHMDSISERMQKATERFANWGTNLRGSPEFENFLKYASERAPMLKEFFGDLGRAIYDAAVALEPFSTVILKLLGYVSEAISYLSEHAPWAIQLLYGLYVATKLWSLAMSMNPVGAVIMGLVLLALAVKYAWDHFEWFREAVKTTWGVIQEYSTELWKKYLQPFFEWFGGIVMWLWETILKPYIGFLLDYWSAVAKVIVWLWTNILKPYIGFLVDYWSAVADGISWLWRNVISPYIGLLVSYWKMVGEAAMWLWRNAIKPAFDGIWLAAKILVALLVTVVFTPIWIGIQAVGAIAKWLWREAIKPAFDAIAAAAVWLWENAIRPALTGIWDGVKWVGDKFTWLYNNAVKPAADWISSKASWLWDKAIRPVLRFIWDGLKWVGDKFTWLYDRSVRPVVDWISDKTDWLYEKGLKPVFSRIKSA